MQLTRTQIVNTATDLIEAEGIEAVSMGRLAAELGCGLMALYSIVPSRQALLDAIAAAVMSAAGVTLAPGISWTDQLRHEGRALRAAATARPRCALMAAARPPVSAAAARPLESTLATLRAAGISGQDAVRVLRVLVAFSTGIAAREAALAPGPGSHGVGDPVVFRPRAGDFPRLTELAAELAAHDPDADFEFGLDLIVRSAAALCPQPATT